MARYANMSICLYIYQAPGPVFISVVASRTIDNSTLKPVTENTGSRGLRTTINTPDAIDNDRLNYMYPQGTSTEEHVPGQCPCDDCAQQQGTICIALYFHIFELEALMNWALMAAQQQHSQAIADATANAEAAQKRGDGPKPMMVTPYKHNWVIAGSSNNEERYAHVHHAILNLDGSIGMESCMISPNSGIGKKT